MNHSSLAMQSALCDEPRSDMGTHLHGRRLLLAWVLWGGVLIFELGMIGVSLPGYLWQLSPDAIQQLEHLGFSVGDDVAFNLAVLLLMAVPSCALVAFLVWRRANDWMALLVCLMLIGIGPLNITNTVLLSQWLGLALASGVLSLSNQINLTIIILAFYLFPDGRFVPRFTRWIVAVGISGNIIFVLFPALGQSVIGGFPFVGVLASLVIAQVYRYRRISTLMQRQQTKWVEYSLAVVIILALSLDVIPQLLVPALLENGSLFSSISSALTNLLTILLPIAFSIAILRYRLWDIDSIINRTLVYGTLTASIVGIYVLVVVSLGALLQTSSNLLISLLATGLVAVLFQPLRERLQLAVNRLMFGKRDTPYQVISHLGQRLEATIEPDSVLPTIVETVAQALKLPYVTIALQQEGELVTTASYGTLKESLTRLPLVYQKEQVGELLLAPRAPGESFTHADRGLLDDLARQVGVAAHAVRLTHELRHLTQDLQQARERLVSAREEERRRLRRDLHDGLGPQLSSQTLLLTSAQMLLRQDPDEAEAILKSAVTQSQQAFTARIPLRRTGFPDDFARVALFLASAASDFMTGNLIVVDGGFLQS